mmetsp:Transcript_24148/g.26812  ORF Transcript_24148/g.26812 Transcript_24148/m.26812 type:complete len:352 (+) Transcript_24148:67-1122(+)
MEIDEVQSPLNYTLLTPDRICVGTKNGYEIFKVDPFRGSGSHDVGSCAIVAIRGKSNFIAVVGNGATPKTSRRKLRVLNLKRRQEIASLTFTTPILRVVMNSQRLAVVTTDKIYLHALHPQFVRLAVIDLGNANPKGLCSLTHAPKGDILMAYPGGTANNDLIIYDCVQLKVRRLIHQAHQAPLQTIVFSRDGYLIATASEKGTLVKVHSVENDDLRLTYRRGSTSAKITCIAFNHDSTLMCVSSENGTVHVFKLAEDNDHVKNSGSYFNVPIVSLLGSAGERSFTSVKLGRGEKSVCEFSRDGSRIYILTADGKFSQYQLPTNHSSQECKIVCQDSIVHKIEANGIARRH